VVKRQINLTFTSSGRDISILFLLSDDNHLLFLPHYYGVKGSSYFGGFQHFIELYAGEKRRKGRLETGVESTHSRWYRNACQVVCGAIEWVA
jgi:hypothetical protein